MPRRASTRQQPLDLELERAAPTTGAGHDLARPVKSDEG
jgi:hypothetical protein